MHARPVDRVRDHRPRRPRGAQVVRLLPQPFDDDPSTVESKLAYTYARPGGCGGDPGAYALTYRAKSNPAVSATLGMGQAGDVDGRRIKTLLAEVSGACDDYWNWSYVAFRLTH